MNEGTDILREVNDLIEPLGCIATGLGPNAVGTKGDRRFVGPSVYVRFKEGMNLNEIGEISTRITNNVRGVSRVLAEIPM